LNPGPEKAGIFAYICYMKCRVTIVFAVFSLLVVFPAFSQEVNPLIPSTKHSYVRCLDMEKYELFLEKQDPGRKARRDAAMKQMAKWTELHGLKRTDSVASYTIPIVFHVLWNSATPAEKISLAQLKRQIEVLNRDYNRINADTIDTPGPFKPAATSFNISFCLAQTDPNGKPTTGVVYKQTSTTSFSYSNNAAKLPYLGGDTIWDPNKYLNIWICNLSGGLLGYSEFPTKPLDNTFGSVIFYEAVGDSGYLPLPAYNLGRTITHEIGHLLDLHHPWGDDGGLCPGSGGTDDGCADTPPEGNNLNDGYGQGWGPTFGCPPFPYTDNCSTTSPGIMFENYMEYSNDSCMNLFTKDQYTIASAALSGPLAILVTSTACTAPSSIQEYIFNASVNVYPNPSPGKFNVAVSLSDPSHLNIEVISVLGQTIQTLNSDNANGKTYSLDLSAQPEGLYFVKISNTSFSIVKKIMVSR